MKKITRFGCVGLLADLPVFVAKAKGYFDDFGLEVTISTELGWTSIEMDLDGGTLQFANIPAVMPLALQSRPGASISALRAVAVTAYEGESLCLNEESLSQIRAARGTKTIRIGVEAPYSFSGYFSKAWARRLHPDVAKNIVWVPLAVSQMIDLLQEGYIHGLCGTEPMGKLATAAGLAVNVIRSGEMFPQHLQSVTVSSERFIGENSDTAKAVAKALLQAREFCAHRENQAEAIGIFVEQKSSIHASSRLVTGMFNGRIETISFAPSKDSLAINELTPTRSIELLCKAWQAIAPTALNNTELRDVALKIFAPLLASERERTT